MYMSEVGHLSHWSTLSPAITIAGQRTLRNICIDGYLAWYAYSVPALLRLVVHLLTLLLFASAGRNLAHELHAVALFPPAICSLLSLLVPILNSVFNGHCHVICFVAL